MHPYDLQRALEQQAQKEAGVEARDYFSLSRVSLPPHQMYVEMLERRSPELSPERLAQFAHDRRMKRDLLSMLTATGLKFRAAPEINIYKGRVRGHPDAVTSENELLHVKPCDDETLSGPEYREEITFGGVRNTRRVPNDDWEQFQIYMHFLKCSSALIVYVARATGAFYVVGLRYDATTANRLNQKLCDCLNAAAQRTPPVCHCRECRGNGHTPVLRASSARTAGAHLTR